MQFFKLYPRWRKLAACAQFRIHNSLPVLLVPLVLPVPLVPLVAPVLPIQNSEFKILSLSHNRRCGSPSQPSQPSHTSHTSHLPHTCIVLIVSLIFLTTHLIHYPLSF
ncbi:hypothetical protein HMPREF9074_07211 [Capnocytophaga sp. oral taxon 329 str. F0087]|nr:hypothetical protein HMPREF9074_07211 [Capnocytophaga sp. oral taxon 329 str. F0087]